MTKMSLRMSPHSLIYLVLLLLISQVAAAQERNDIAARLAGSWAGEGKAFGMPSRPEMRWELALNGKFIKLTYKTEMKSSKGETQIFEGHGYYKSLGGGKYQGTWFDSQGEQHPINATFENDALMANWGTPETKLGKTVYRLITPNEMELTDSIRRKDGTWQEFSRARLKRI